MILVDTTPLVALCDRRDAHHKRAVRQLEKLAPSTFATCDGVLAEACFHLTHVDARRRLHDLLRELDVVTLPREPDSRFRQAVFDWLVKYADQDPDWADACLAVLSGLDATIKVWTYDGEFQTTWRRPDAVQNPARDEVGGA